MICFSYTRPTDELRQRQLDQILGTLNQAYKQFSQQDIPENVFNVLFNHTLTTPSSALLNDAQVKEEKNEIHRLLWELIQRKSEGKYSAQRWSPGMVLYPALIIQLLRVRFPSPEPDVVLSDCIKCNMSDFIKYTCS